MPSTSLSGQRNFARWSLVAAVLVTIAAIAAALVLTEPLPPRKLVIATGTEGTPYHEIGQQYSKIFARHGIKLEVRPTNGSVENIHLLEDPRSDVSVALVQSGTTTEEDSPHLRSLGTLFYEPLWLFARDQIGDETKPLRPGMRISLGAAGSGTHMLAHEVAGSMGVDLTSMELFEFSESDAAGALMRGELDFVAMSMSWRSPIIQQLLSLPSISLVGWPQADAHVALRPYLSKRIFPRGLADLRNDRPPRDVVLVATKASLIVRDDLHAALQHLLLEAASELHSSPGVFNAAGEFPAAQPLDLPLSDTARDYYRSGKPFLQRYLPFWLAALTTRLLVLLVPILGIAYPLFRLLPALFAWSIRRRIYALYGELKFLEFELRADPGSQPPEILEQLDQLEERANRIRVPAAFANLLYTLKHHIGLVRERISELNRRSNNAPQAHSEENP
ncbi:MAG: C4-dicarboxylate ABC transporter substrate-binding protein [Betaproteobacteria bacterium]|nr:MAG: C4-dicarboxylate ABC transporter substrate-binding protein [Betaproteobacteria bacterium]